jgi:hypothetical protein
LTQAPKQSVVDGSVHTGTQALFTQASPAGHTVPQPPQFAASEVGSMQAPLHNVWPVAQCDAHAPLEHTCPVVHGVPHAPQWTGLDWSSTQRVSHSVSPVEHPHTPDVQISLNVHMTPQPPQLPGSSLVSTQPPSHSLRPPVQLAVWVHTPPEHTVPAVHMWLHAPQFAPLESRSTHAPLQSSSPGAHAHVPATHPSGAVHA